MAAKKFIPKNVGSTKQEIHTYIQDEIECCELEFSYKKSLLTDKVCQEFVNKMHDVQEEYIDNDEEDLVDARLDIITKLLGRICSE